MKVLNKRGLISAIITSILLIISLMAYYNSAEIRFMISSVLSLILSIVYFIKAFSTKSIVEEIAENNDERDLYLVMKTSHLTIKTMAYILYSFIVIFLMLYGIYKSQFLIIVVVTLCSIHLFTFIIYLSLNIYFEKHE